MVVQKPGATENLNSMERSGLCNLKGLVLCCLGLAHKRLVVNTATPACRCPPYEQTRRVELHRHLRRYKRYTLVGSNWTTKSNAPLCIILSILKRSASYAAGNSPTQNSVECCSSYHTTIARLAQQICRSNRRIFEGE